MAIDAIVGIVSAIGDAVASVAAPAVAADVGAGVAADVGAGVAAGAGAADVAGAIALPEIVVEGAAPAIEAGAAGAAGLGADVGAGIAGGLTAADVGAGAAGATILGDLGISSAEAAGLTPAQIVGGEFAAAGQAPSDVVGGDFANLPAGAGAASPTPPVSTVGAGAGGVTSAQEALSGATGPLTALSPEDFNITPYADVTNPQFPATGSTGVSPAVATALNTGQIGSQAAGEGLAETPAAAELAGTGVQAPGVPASLQATDLGPTIGEGVAAAPTAGAPTSLAAPAAAGGAGAAATPAGGITGALSSVLASPWTRAAELAAPLGALGLTLVRGQPSLPPAMEQALSQLGPAESLASTELTNAANNQITPAQAQEIATYKQNATNQLYQLYASMGRDPSGDTDFLQGVAQINANAIAMQQQFIDAMIQNGLAAQGQVSSELNAAANLQVAQDQAFQQSISSALQSFGLVAAISSTGQRAAPATA